MEHFNDSRNVEFAVFVRALFNISLHHLEPSIVCGSIFWIENCMKATIFEESH